MSDDINTRMVGRCSIHELETEINARCLYALVSCKMHDPTKSQDDSHLFVETGNPALLRMQTADGSQVDFFAFQSNTVPAGKRAAEILSSNDWVSTDQMSRIHGADEFETEAGVGCRLPDGSFDKTCDHLSFGSSRDAQGVWFLSFLDADGEVDFDRSIVLHRVGEDVAEMVKWNYVRR
jgi:hypothetical protein